MRVLVVEDDPEIRELIALALKSGFECLAVASGEKALQALWEFVPDVLLLDLTLPGFQGGQLLQLIRNDPKISRLPVIILTADHSEKTILDAFDKGADDVITKPFSPLELSARVRVLQRWNDDAPPGDRLSAGPIVLVLSSHRVTVAGDAVVLTHTEFSILQFLLQQAGTVVSKARLIEFLLGNAEEVRTRTIDTHLANLRRKLGPAGTGIETIRELGIRLNF